MDNVTIDIAAADPGAVLMGARSPWMQVATAGASHALGQSPILAAGRVDERHAAFRQASAKQTTRRTAPLSAQLTQPAALTGDLPMTGTPSVVVNRKPNNVHKTRINAGGYGAMGPHPERERLA